MYRLMFIVAALLCGAAAVAVSVATAGETMRATDNLPQIVVYDNENFLGDHTHLW